MFYLKTKKCKKKRQQRQLLWNFVRFGRLLIHFVDFKKLPKKPGQYLEIWQKGEKTEKQFSVLAKC